MEVQKQTIAEEFTAESYSKKSELNDMKQHADKIIQGIKGLTEKDASRAIWELFQNAIDLSENCEISIQLNEDTLKFEHNGEPFNPSTLDCLFKQVSSKTLEEIKIEFAEDEPVGQYGTGFISTHSFGKIITIGGSLKKKGGYVPIKTFVIDRNTNNWRSLSESIYNLKKQVESMLNGVAITEEPSKVTSFTYQLTSPVNKERAAKAINSLPGILPYVLIFNKKLKKVSVINKQGEQTVYTRAEETIDNEKAENTIFINDKPIKVNYLKSKRLIVILPLAEDNMAFYFSDNLPKLFLFYPLVGTEKFGFNFLLHSRNFLPTEPRDGLYLNSTNTDNKMEEDANQNLIDEASGMIFNYVLNHLPEIKSPAKLAKINFKVDGDDSILNEYFLNLKKKWTDQFKDYRIVQTLQEDIKPTETAFLASELIEITEGENDKSFESVFAIASKFYKNLPLKDLIREWTQRVDEWDLDDIQYITFESLAKYIEIEGKLCSFDTSDLITFYDLIFEKGPGDLFNVHALLPNIKGELRKLTDLNESIELTEDLIAIADIIDPDVSKKQIDSGFMFNLNLESFGRKKYTVQINAAIEEKVKSDTKGSDLPEGYLKAMVKLASITTVANSSSTPLLIVEDICTYYKYLYRPINIVPNENKEDELDPRSTQAKLLRCFLNDISHENPDWVQDNLKYLYNVLSKIVGYSNYAEIYKYVSVFPNQLYELIFLSKLDIDGDIPPDIKEMYDKVMKPDKPIKAELIHKDFYSIHKDGKTRSTNDLTAKIEDEFFGDMGLTIEINDHKYKKEILEIIQSFKEREGDIAKAKRYQGYYQRLNANKNSILVQLADGEDSFSILSLDKNRIKKLAELGTNPDLFDIIQLGKAALQDHKQERADFQHKKTIGNHLENVLRRELQQIIPLEIRSEVKDVQGGQDIIIFIGSEEAYYIEVKSKWLLNTPIRLSKTQTNKCFEKKHHYSLCSINMVNYSEQDRLEVKSIQSIKEYVRFNNDIGNRVDHLIDSLTQTPDSEQFYLDGDIRTIVPQSYIANGMSLHDFEEYLVNYLRNEYGKQN